jgi:ABC-type oligopeptide transport system substrate-binding subunit
MQTFAAALLLTAGCNAAPISSTREGLTQPQTAVLTNSLDFDWIDPALSFTLLGAQMEFATCAKLLNYADAGGTPQLVPELAAAMPTVSADGLTYQFQIRSGFAFSTGEPVTAATIKNSYDRATTLRVQNRPGPGAHLGRNVTSLGPATGFMQNLASISVGGGQQDQLTFTLKAPQGDFVHRVAMGFFCVVPLGTPNTPQFEPIASAGPYYIDSYVPVNFDNNGNPISEGSLVLKKNPYYGGARSRYFDVIHYRLGLGLDVGSAITLAESGAVDYVADQIPPNPVPPAYGNQLFTNPELAIAFLALNTIRPAFSNADFRRAVNYAIDRAALAAIDGGPVNDNYLPPLMPGYNGAHLYPLSGPDASTARSLLAGATPSVALYAREGQEALAQAVQSNLSQAGFSVTTQIFPIDQYFSRLFTPGEPYDLAFIDWFADYPDPFDFLNNLLDGNNLAGANFSNFNDASFNQELEAAATLLGQARYDRYGQLDVEAMQKAPLAVYDNPVSRDFFSSRIGCQTFNGLYGMDLALLCLK